MKVGIIGLPGSGKTTLFQLLTESFEPPDYSKGNKPTLKRVNVSDARLERLRDDYSPKKYTPAQLDILDFPAVAKDGQDRSGVADLLAPAREADALIVTLRAFKSASVAGGDSIDPAGELAEVRGELILSDLVSVERRIEKLEAKKKKPT
ncbi:MAG: GTPase, partial [Planctomycetota bacterium]